MDSLWALGIVHRDIKPENVIKLDTPERPFVLIDLGIAFSVIDTPLTVNPYQIPGTARYIAPEMLKFSFRKSLDYRSDLYTAGLTVYEYASGIYPFAQIGDDLYKTFYRIEKEKAAPLKAHRPDLSDSFVLIIEQLLRKKPVLRPSNIEGLIRQLEAGT
ncbi:MAG: protein kinase [Thermodesulfobacteriota bacterium]|nr:MAG: protein kinase [Thermodesulfobacteriota bacterium]